MICHRCKQDLPVEDFALNRSSARGRQSACKACRNAHNRAKRKHGSTYGTYPGSRTKFNPNRTLGSITEPKVCNHCKTLLPAEDFTFRKDKRRQRAYLSAYCKACTRVRKAANDTLPANLRRYGLTVDAYNALQDQQGGVCAICQQPCSTFPRLSVDHCHTSGKIRGLLCSVCNLAIGALGDDPERLRAAAAYLERHQQ